MESKRRTAARVLAWLLCLLMVLSVFDGTGLLGGQALAAAGTAGGTPGVNQREADPSTMETYTTALLSEDTGSRYAGRVWTDKTVFAYGADQNSGGTEGNRISLTADLDGYESSMGFTSDFAHVFSALTSSQVVNEYPPTPIDLVIVFDMSGSMGQDTRSSIDTGVDNYVGHPGYLVSMADRIAYSRVQQTLNAINTTIDKLMAQNQQNRVAVLGYGANAVVLMPLAHYRHAGDSKTPYLTVGGMETLYHPSDLVYLKNGESANGVTVSEDGWYWTNNRDTCYTVVVNAGNESNIYTGPLKTGTPEQGNNWVTMSQHTVSNNALNSSGERPKAFPGAWDEDGKTPTPDAMKDQQKHTVYTIYRFACSKTDRNMLRRNPVYGAVPQSLLDTWAAHGDDYPEGNSEYASTPGVYRLSDIRVWVEEYGDFVDTDGAITPTQAYSSSLYVNVPAAALPTQLAEITMGPDGVLSYKSTPAQPLRLFYAVGLDDDYLMEDGSGVDIAAIPMEYVQQHRDSQNRIPSTSPRRSCTPWTTRARMCRRSLRGPAMRRGTSSSGPSRRRYTSSRWGASARIGRAQKKR